MKNICLFLGVVLFIIISIVSCRPKEGTSKDNGFLFDTLRSTNNYHINNDSTQPSCNIKMTFVYPSSYTDGAILDSIQKIFISCFFDDSYIGLTPKEAIKSYEKNYIESYKEDFKIFSQDRDDHDENESYSPYYEIDNNEVTFNKAGIISFQITQTNFKGGASSYDFMKSYTIDVSKLQLIDENDIFNDGFEKAFNVIFRDKLFKMRDVKNISELENMGYFGIEEMIPNGNFTLNDKGITYTFNKGEYSSLKTDPIVIFIPYEEIAPLIKEDSLISKFISA